MRKWVCAGLAVLCLLISGCGTSSSSGRQGATSGKTTYTYAAGSAQKPPCVAVRKAIALPAGFPRQFPFPRGTYLYKTKPLIFKHQIGIYGYVPSPSFATTVNFFKNQVPKQGFKRLDFEVDTPNDSEGRYQGFGKIGAWALRALPACKGFMAFSASAEPIGAGPLPTNTPDTK
jgi:hypothetical protein